MWLWIAIAALAALMLYIRLAPSDPARWHSMLDDSADKDFAGGALRVIEGDAARMAELDRVIRASGARVLKGSAVEGHVTYISRTRVMGFPDYTTVQLKEGKIALYGRLRFGRSDLGVNKRRLEGWLSQLG